MNEKNKLTTTQEEPALHELETSDLQALIGGRVEIYGPVSYPTAGLPWPSPWRAAAFPFPDPWLVAGQQQPVIGT